MSNTIENDLASGFSKVTIEIVIVDSVTEQVQFSSLQRQKSMCNGL